MYLFNIRRRHIPGGTITRKSIADAAVTLPKNSYAYTGEAISPLPTVRLGDTLLAANEDYTVSYSDNTDVGMATITVAGTGNYYGTATVTFYITAAPASWADFEFTNLGDAVASAGLRDSGASGAFNQNIDTYHIQVLPDGRLHFGGQNQGHAYIWDFEDGHPFEVGHFKSTYDSRSPYVENFGSSVLDNGGLSGYYSIYGSSGLVPFSLSAAYDLSTRNSSSAISMPSGYAMHMAFSQDGTKFFFKRTSDSFLYCRELTTPFDPSAYTPASVDLFYSKAISLDTVTGESLTWRDFFFSPDGRFMVATSGNGAGLVHKFELPTPWDITTLRRTSYKQLFAAGSYANLNAVAINSAGTKMIVFDYYTNGADGFKFYEYDLTA